MVSVSRRWKIICAVGAVVLVASVVTVGIVVSNEDETKKIRAAADDFALAWTESRLDQIAYEGGISGADVKSQYQNLTGNMSSAKVEAKTSTAEEGKIKQEKGSGASALIDVSWKLDGEGQWTYQTTLTLRKTDDSWLPRWESTVIHPKLRDGDHLQLETVQADRADILGAGDQEIVTNRPVVEIGVVPQRVSDIDALTSRLSSLLDIDGRSLATRIRNAKPDAFVDVITLRQEDYLPLRDKLQPLSGTTFRETTMSLSPSKQFAAALLGRVGPVTAEMIKEQPNRHKSGDTAGLSGLQKQYDDQLSGTDGVSIDLVHSDGQSEELFAAESKPGTPLRITIDQHTQQAAEAALDGVSKPSAFVAMRVSTGEILAVANGPESTGFNRALEGKYPPGSSFKTVTAYSLLEGGMDDDDTVDCPPTVNIGGREFKNAEDKSFGVISFRKAFSESCNTAFANLSSSKLSNESLKTAASAFGIEKDWNIGVSAFTGAVPTATSKVDLTASSFGQGRVQMSPLAMANVASSVARGSWLQPKLVQNESQQETTSLDSDAIEDLRTFMREVVVSGTGTKVADVPGGPVFAKTGTAEFGTDSPPKSHAWFVGYQDDIAFTAFVEGGEFGGEVAAPIAAEFLTSLN